MKTVANLLAAACAILALPAAAQSSPWYVGAAIGLSKADSSLVRDREATIGPGIAQNIGSSSDLNDTAGKLYVGYRLSPVFSLEANYANLGRQRIDSAFDVPYGATGRGAVATRREVDGFGLDVLAGWEASPGLTLFGKAGAFRGKAKTDTTLSGDTSFADGSPGTFRSRSASETIAKYGLGAQYAFARNLAGRLVWERYPDLGKRLAPGSSGAPGEATQDAFWLGVTFRFQ
jgi:opacity protein-like surface antigen